MTSHPAIPVKSLGIHDYQSLWHSMQHFNAHRGAEQHDEIWLAEHYPVYTLGLAGKREHLLLPEETIIPVINCDRGGQVTYHAPGQIMVYTLIHLQSRKIGVRDFVALLEQAVIEVLQRYGIVAHREFGKPGVYVCHKKIAALGLRVKKGSCYHGLALNVCLPLSPFRWINPCGFAKMEVTDVAHALTKQHPDAPPLHLPASWGNEVAKSIIQLLTHSSH
jgi:lipoyl(octanoyl) transferase